MPAARRPSLYRVDDWAFRRPAPAAGQFQFGLVYLPGPLRGEEVVPRALTRVGQERYVEVLQVVTPEVRAVHRLEADVTKDFGLGGGTEGQLHSLGGHLRPLEEAGARSGHLWQRLRGGRDEIGRGVVVSRRK